MSATRTIPTEKTADLVTVELQVGGKKLKKSVAILSVVVQRTLNRIPTAKVILTDGDAASENFPLSEEETFIPGQEIEIKAGYQTETNTIFKGIIVKHTIKLTKMLSARLVVECKDVAYQLTLGKKKAFFYDTYDHEIIEDILSEYKKGGKALYKSTVDATNTKHTNLVQAHVSDWDFILMRAEANGLLVNVVDGNLEIKKPDVTSEPLVSVLQGGSMLEFEGGIDARMQMESYEGSFWDEEAQAVETLEAEAPEELGDTKGSEWAKELHYSNQQVWYAGMAAAEEVQAVADSGLQRSRLGKMRGRVRFQGLDTLVPGRLIELAGLGKRFNGSAFVNGVRHEVSGGNWVSDVDLGLPTEAFSEQFPGTCESLLPTMEGLHVGVVTQLEGDPLNAYRIKVNLPQIDEKGEGIWARVALLDAGPSRGAFFLPEVEDEVLVGFLANNPKEPVVLGALHTSKKEPPLELTDDNHEKGWITRGHTKLWFNDDDPSLEISTEAGNKILVSDAEESITLIDQHGNQLLMSKDGITIDSSKDVIISAKKEVKISGKNVSIEAKSKAEFKGSSGTTVGSGGSKTDVKGQKINLN